MGDRWLDVAMIDGQPLNKTLSGLALEYRLIELYSRDVGRREAKLVFDVGQGTQDLGFRNEVNILFDCEPAVEVMLEVLDDDGKPTTGQFVFATARAASIRRMSRRLAPDFFFHEQIYRHSGESVLLPPGKYTVHVQPRAGVSSAHRRDHRARLGLAQGNVSSSSAGSSWPTTAGSRAIITSTPPAARTTNRRPKACSRST